MSISELLKALKTDVDSMSLVEKLLGGCATAVLAMAVVFVVLVLIMYIIKIINPTPKEKIIDEKLDTIKYQENNELIDQRENTELVAVIAAAIMASGSKNIIVKRITRTNNRQSNWENHQI